jgi:Ca-activated chloride channel family protein
VTRRPLRPLAAVILALAAAGPAPGQQPTFRTNVDLVRVDVLATERGRPIAGLAATDFELLDNGVPQEITALFADTLGLDVFFVFDTSGSVEGATLQHLKEAANAVLDGLRDGDRAQLLTFSHRARLPLRLTADMAALRRAIETTEARGATALLDALYIALVNRETSPSRSVVLLFSDGQDNRSWLSPEQVLRVARETEVVIDAVAFRPPWVASRAPLPLNASEPDEELLRNMTRATGGQLVLEKESQQLKKVFLRLLAEMRARYVLTYYPRGVTRAGWHALTVRLRSRPGRIVARPGYMVQP